MLRPGTVHQLRSHHCLVQRNNYFLCHAVNTAQNEICLFCNCIILSTHTVCEPLWPWTSPTVLLFLQLFFHLYLFASSFLHCHYYSWHLPLSNGSKACHKSRMAANSDAFLQNTYNLSQLVTQKLYVCLFPSYNS